MESEKDLWVEKTLNSLDGIERAVPSTGLQARIMQRIQAEKFTIKPDIVRAATIYRIAAAIALIVTMNVITCVMFSKSVSEKKELNNFAKEYFMSDNNDGIFNM